LIELLIVIAVIAVMAGLIYSVMMQSRRRAYLANCISNLRQLVMAVHAYEDDWGMVPLEYYVKTPEGVYGQVQQLIYPYVRDDNVFLCPLDYSRGEKVGWGVIVWKNKEWRKSYHYFINEVTVEMYNVTRPFPEMVVFYCCWHLDDKIDLIARYDGRIEIAPLGRYKRISVIPK
jgi:hypothetical protein